MSKYLINDAVKSWLSNKYGIALSITEDSVWHEKFVDAQVSGELDQSTYGALLQQGAKKMSGQQPSSPADALYGGSQKGDVRVFGPGRKYKTVKEVGKHAKTGQPVLTDRGLPAELPSEYEHAKAGAFLKHLANRSGVVSCPLSDHDRELLEATYGDTWAGKMGSSWVSGISGQNIKSLLNDTISGGSYAVPEFWDDNVIVTPLLRGELYPFCDVVNMTRGNAAETASVGVPTVSWSYSEGTAISPFDTADLVAEVSATVHTVSVALEVGRDFMQDSPADIGRILTEAIGMRFLNELDRVIALGNGTSQPEGILNASGVTDNPFGSDPATVSDYEGLLLGVGKELRDPATRSRQVFIGNETSYRRARSIAIGAADQRRVFGMTHEDYMLLDHPYKIVPGLSNTQIAFGNLSKYRLWRRAGMELRFEAGGKELVLKNLVLLVARARFAGRVVDSNAFVMTDDAEA